MKLKNYQFHEKIGIGMTSRVSLVEDVKTKKFYAMKTIKRNNKMKAYGENEKDILEIISNNNTNNSQCPYLVNVHEICEENDEINIILDYFPGGDLIDKINESTNGYLNEDEARFYFHQIIEAISYLHSLNIYHLDLKLENMLLDENGNLHLIDFGFAIMSTGEISKHCGTPYYLAPELLTQQSYQGGPVDIWACGIILYIMLTGCYPFSGVSFNEMKSNILEGELSFPSTLSDDAVDLLLHIIERDTSRRFTLEDIKNHPWYNDFKPCIPAKISPKELMDIETTLEKNPYDKHENSSIRLVSSPNGKPTGNENCDQNQIIEEIEKNPPIKTEKELMPDQHLNDSHITTTNEISRVKNSNKNCSIFTIAGTLSRARQQIEAELYSSDAIVSSNQGLTTKNAEMLEVKLGKFRKLKFIIFLIYENEQTAITIQRVKGNQHQFMKIVKRIARSFN